jgi:hypothetical protein
MSPRDTYLERMTARLADAEGEIQARAAGGAEDATVRELQATLGVARERLQLLRRAGAELDEETTRGFAQAFDRLNAGLVRARGQGHPDAA